MELLLWGGWSLILWPKLCPFFSSLHASLLLFDSVTSSLCQTNEISISSGVLWSVLCQESNLLLFLFGPQIPLCVRPDTCIHVYALVLLLLIFMLFSTYLFCLCFVGHNLRKLSRHSEVKFFNTIFFKYHTSACGWIHFFSFFFHLCVWV